MKSWLVTGAGAAQCLDDGARVQPVPDPEGYNLLYYSDFADNSDGWVARTETQSNDNSYNTPLNVSYGPRGMVVLGKRENLGGRPFTTADVTGQHIVVPNWFRADVVATLPTDYGMWPAPLWFRPLNSPHGEIDLCETWTYDWGSNPRFYVSIHQDYSATDRKVTAPLSYSMLSNSNPGGTHTYTVIKSPGRMEFLCDGMRAYCWNRGSTWNGTLRIGDVPTWWDTYMEVSDRTWYPRVTLQIGGPETPDPPTGWTQSEMVIHSLRIYTPEA